MGQVFNYRAYGQAGTVISGSNTSVLFDNNWHYVIWTVDSLRNVRVYIDGKQTGNTTNISNSTEIYYKNIAYGYGANLYMWNGFIDDVRIYNAVLSFSKIRQNYIAGLESLLSKGSISKKDYNQRIKLLVSNAK